MSATTAAPPAPAENLLAYFRSWLSDAPGIPPRTAAEYLRVLADFREALELDDLRQTTAMHVDRYVTRLGFIGLSERQRARALRALEVFFAWAAAAGIIEWNPTANARTPGRQNASTKARKPSLGGPRPCETCGAPFLPRRRKQRFHTEACRRRFHDGPPALVTSARCASCGSVFAPSSRRLTKFCTPRCRRADWKRRHAT